MGIVIDTYKNTVWAETSKKDIHDILAACNKHELKRKSVDYHQNNEINHSYEDFVVILHDGRIPLKLKIALYVKGTLEYLKYSQEFCTRFPCL